MTYSNHGSQVHTHTYEHTHKHAQSYTSTHHPQIKPTVPYFQGIRPVKNGGWWRWALVSLDGVAPSRVVGVPPSVNLPLHHKVQKFSSGTDSPGWSWKKGRKMVVVRCGGGVPYFQAHINPNYYFHLTAILPWGTG